MVTLEHSPFQEQPRCQAAEVSSSSSRKVKYVWWLDFELRCPVTKPSSFESDSDTFRRHGNTAGKFPRDSEIARNKFEKLRRGRDKTGNIRLATAEEAIAMKVSLAPLEFVCEHMMIAQRMKHFAVTAGAKHKGSRDDTDHRRRCTLFQRQSRQTQKICA